MALLEGVDPKALLPDTVELRLSCRGLPKMDLLSHSDPFAVLYGRDKLSGNWTELARTEAIKDTENPDFVTPFDVDFLFEEVQSFKVEVYDHDCMSEDLKKHDYIGSASFVLGHLMGSQGQILALPLSKANMKKARGTLHLRAELKSHNNDLLHVQFAANKLDNLDGLFSKSDPFIEISRATEDGVWTVVWRSPYCKNNSSPTWPEARIKVQTLCNGDYHRPIKCEVYDYDHDSPHDLIGAFQSSVQEFIAKAADGLKFDVINEKKKARRAKKKLGKKYVNSGTVRVARCVVEKRPSFLEYITGGAEMNLVVAIDFTASNAQTGLHNISATPNQYQEAISATGQILLEYDTDQLVPTYGFGGCFVNRQTVDHCFALTYRRDAPEARGLGDVLQLYASSLQKVLLSGPTLFAPLLREVSARATAAEQSALNIAAAAPVGTVTITIASGPININIVPTHGDQQQLDMPTGPDKYGVAFSHFSRSHPTAVGEAEAQAQGKLVAGMVLLQVDCTGAPGDFRGMSYNQTKAHLSQRPITLTFQSPEAAQTAGARPQCTPEYTILLLLTDGVIMDMGETKRALVDASALPLSVVIVGIGDADFTAMEQLDSDDALLTDDSGRTAKVRHTPLLIHPPSLYTTPLLSARHRAVCTLSKLQTGKRSSRHFTDWRTACGRDSA
jgi:hypothetical protein